MKVFFDTGVGSGHDVRGIGVHTAELFRQFKTEGRKLKAEVVSDRDSADIIHITSFKPFEKNTIPFLEVKGKKIVLTIHDLIPLIYPKHYPPGMKGRLNFLVNKYKIKKNVDAIITISETSKKDICRFLKINPKKVHVVYLAPSKEYKATTAINKFKLPKSFVFYIGDVNYNKNIPMLVNACRNLGVRLVIAGKHAKEVEKLNLNHPELTHLKNVNFSDVVRLGFISNEDANGLYNLASVFVQPSLYEGFGLPVVQGFASGCPVIAARTQALVEIGGDPPAGEAGAVLYFDPKDQKDLEEKISKVLKNEKIRDGLIKKGFERVGEFSWEKTAKETLRIYEKV